MEGVNLNTDMNLDIETMIPHRGRMRLIEKVVAVDNQKALTAATTSEDWPLYRDGSVDVLVTIELVAQTAALLEVNEGADGEVKRFGVEAAEALVDEDSV